MKNFSEKMSPFSSDDEYEGEAPIPRRSDKVYGPDGSYVKEDVSAGYELPSKMRERRAAGWRKKGRTTIPIFEIIPDEKRKLKGWKEVEGNDSVTREPVYDDEEPGATPEGSA